MDDLNETLAALAAETKKVKKAEKKEAKRAARAPVEVYEYEGESFEPVKIKPGAIQNSGFVEGADGKSVLIPHMSSEQLAENEPAQGKGLVRVRAPEGIGQQTFLTLLSNAYALYVLEGTYSNDSLQRRTGMVPGTIAKVLNSPEFKHALKIRGVELNATGLTHEQELCLQILTDPSDGKTLGQKLKLAGVTYAKYRAWMKQPIFKLQMDTLTAGLLSSNADALVQLDRLANEGDLGAIKFKFELNGLYDPNKQQNIDIVAMMGKMLEIITKYVRDPETLNNVAGELGQLAQDLKIGEVRQIGA